ncbi:hypothetical protein MKX01_039839 [Papaver californicum]|nr:hypothetical protein MKX01_039839 [Papaver californicum]
MAAKISMFLSFFLFVLIVMPASSSSRIIVEVDQEVVDARTCGPKVRCLIVCPGPPKACPRIGCINGFYTPCCGCPKCCPAA